MPKFIAVHPLPKPATADEGAPIAKMARANSTREVYWVRSWAQCNEGGKITKLLCEWNAGSADAVKEALKNVPVPTEGVYPLVVVDSEDYR